MSGENGLIEAHGEAIDTWVESQRDEIVDLLSRIVQLRSDFHPPDIDENRCQAAVAEAYAAAGLEVDIFALDDVPELFTHPLTTPTWDGRERPLANRRDVVGVLPGAGDGRSLLISSHVDTVGVDAKDWSDGEPFSGRVEGGRLYGRGSWDTKWGIIAGLFTARCLAELGLPHRGDVIIESVVDEEFGGSHGTLAARLRGYRADFAFNCEPTSMLAGIAHRGGGEWRIFVRGEDRGLTFAGDEPSSSAVDKLGAMIRAIGQWNTKRNRDRTPALAFVENPELPAYIEQVNGGGCSYAEVTGVPEECNLVVWVEEEPGVTEAMHHESFVDGLNSLLTEDPAFSDGVLPEYRRTIRYLPGSETVVPPDIMTGLSAAYDSAGVSFRCAGVPLACDTYVFNLYSNIPALTIGPRGGNAHAANEYVCIDDILKLVRIFTRTAAHWCT